MRRILGVLVAAAVLAAAAIATRAVDVQRLDNVRANAARTATEARQRAADALRVQLESLQIEASAAANLQQLVQILTLLGNHQLEDQVGKTLQSFFREEKPWEPFRRKFKVFGLSVEGDQLQVVQGIAARDLASETLVRQARERGQVSGTVMGKDWPYAAAAAPVSVSGVPDRVILVLARPFDEAMLKEAAERAGGAVLLSDGRTVLAQSGSKPEIELLTPAVGHEQDKQGPVASDGAWAAAAAPIAPKLWLWVHASALAAARDAEASALTTKAIAWAVAVLIAALSLFLTLRRQPPVGATPMMPLPTSGVMAPMSSPPPTAVVPSTGAGEPASGYGSTMALAGPPAVAPRPTAGMPFGRYLLLERLGEGGMSQVYTAVTFGAEGFRRKFVVKRLRPELTADPAVVAQFIDEANMASSLVHSNIVPVFDFGKEGEEYFLATEYILGRDLSRIVRQIMETDRTHMPVGLVLYCALETLKALEYAHTKRGEGGRPLGLVHRDVSPNNILVSARGEVKLFDFGIVKAEGRVTKTQHGVVKGNVSFMSPEQARGLDIDARADLFSMGLVLFYCLTGEVLYQGGTTYELLIKAASGPGVEERARIQALPAPAATVVARALETDPARRFQSAGEFAAALAPLVRSSSNDLAAVMQRLFAQEFHDEEKRFSAAFPGGAGANGRTTPPQANTRRS